MADLCERLRRWVVPFLTNEGADKNVVIVAHGDTIRALRIIIEGIDPARYNHLLINDDPYLDTSNCQIVQYASVNPSNPTDTRSQPTWVRSLCPAYKKAPANYDWQPINPPQYNNSELLQMSETYPRLIA